MVGASGAIAGVLAAYLVYFPNARVTALLFFGIFARIIPVPAILLVGLWAILQFFSGVASLTAMAEGGVAYWAHIGGFVAGFVLASPLRPMERRHAPTYYYSPRY
jgi:membrane associated rhomboid family serine protease